MAKDILRFACFATISMIVSACDAPVQQSKPAQPAPQLSFVEQAMNTQLDQIYDLRRQSPAQLLSLRCGSLFFGETRLIRERTTDEIRRDLARAESMARQLPQRMECVRNNIQWSLVQESAQIREANALLADAQANLLAYPDYQETKAYQRVAKAMPRNERTPAQVERAINGITDDLGRAQEAILRSVSDQRADLRKSIKRRKIRSEAVWAGVNAGLSNARRDFETSMRQINQRNAVVTGMPVQLTPRQQEQIRAEVLAAQRQSVANDQRRKTLEGKGLVLTANYLCKSDDGTRTFGWQTKKECAEKLREYEEIKTEQRRIWEQQQLQKEQERRALDAKIEAERAALRRKYGINEKEYQFCKWPACTSRDA